MIGVHARLQSAASASRAPLPNWLFTPELQWQFRGKMAYLTRELLLVRLTTLHRQVYRVPHGYQVADG
jgi:hypothetical protein